MSEFNSNVSSDNGRYVIRKDSNSQYIMFQYAVNFTGVASNEQLLVYAYNALKLQLSNSGGNDKLRRYFRSRKFIKLSTGIAKAPEINGIHTEIIGVAKVTGHEKVKRTKVLPYYEFDHCIMASDLASFGISEKDINIVGGLYYIELQNGAVKPASFGVHVRTTGWYINETTPVYTGWFNRDYRPKDEAFKEIQKVANEIPHVRNDRDVDMSGVFLGAFSFLTNGGQYLAHVSDKDVAKLLNRDKEPIRYKEKCSTKEECEAVARHELAAMTGDTSRFEQLMKQRRSSK